MKVVYIGGAPRAGVPCWRWRSESGPRLRRSASCRWQKGVLESQLCGCGERFLDCPFWSTVGEAAFGGWEHVDAQEMVRLRSSVDKARFVPLALVPWLLPGYRARAVRYASCLERIYKAVAEVSRCRSWSTRRRRRRSHCSYAFSRTLSPWSSTSCETVAASRARRGERGIVRPKVPDASGFT